MREVAILQVELLPTGELCVTPSGPHDDSYQFIYRAATGVAWNDTRHCFISPVPKEWSHFDWFVNILSSVASELGMQLVITPDTAWLNVPNELQSQMLGHVSGNT